jgi:hypothetical protein
VTTIRASGLVVASLPNPLAAEIRHALLLVGAVDPGSCIG